MSLKGLRILALVAQVRNLNKVADLLQTTQPTVSRHLRALEEEFGLPLVEHRTRPIQLTSAGAQLAELCQEFLSNSELLGRVPQAATQDAPLVVAAPLAVASGILPAVLSAYRRIFPKSSIVIDSSQLKDPADLIAERKIDIGFTTSPRIPANCETRMVLQYPLLLMTVKGHPLTKMIRPSLEHVVGFPLVMAHRGSHQRTVLDRALAERGLRPTIAVEVDNTHLVRRYVSAGFGVSIGTISNEEDIEISGIEMIDMSERFYVEVKMLVTRALEKQKQIDVFVRSIEMVCRTAENRNPSFHAFPVVTEDNDGTTSLSISGKC